MSDNLQIRGRHDRNRVNLAQYHEIQYWSEKLGCSPQELRKAVARVGDSADAVQRELRRNASTHH